MNIHKSVLKPVLVKYLLAKPVLVKYVWKLFWARRSNKYQGEFWMKKVILSNHKTSSQYAESEVVTVSSIKDANMIDHFSSGICNKYLQ